jgi:hypothetical protein
LQQGENTFIIGHQNLQGISCKLHKIYTEFRQNREGETNNGIVILYANARSIRNKLDEIKAMTMIYSPDILAICETWLASNEVNYYNLDGYEGVFNCRNSDNRGGSTLFYIKTHINYKILFTDDKYNVTIIEINRNNERQKICIFYRSPTQDSVETFLQYFDDLLMMYKSMLIIGDSNINLLEKSNTVYEYKSLIYTNNYKIINRISEAEATRVTNNTRTIIDHILDNKISNKHIINLYDWPNLDHKVIRICIERKYKEKQKMIKKNLKL